jgi:CheY-like chemotaxis protein
MPIEPPQAPAAVADSAAVGTLRVLVVEDSPTNRWLAQRQLERLGLTVDGVEDGYAALDRVATCHYDLVLTDCHMPGMDGTILASHIRMAEATRSDRRTPIIGLTADITVTMRQRCLAAGMDGVEIKPINLKRLEHVLRQLFQRQFNAPAPAPVPAQAEAAADAPVFDRSPYRELFELGDPEGASWLKGYLQSAAAALERVQESISAGDRKALSESAHRLAGSSLCVGARRLGETCRRLEALAGLGEPEPLRGLTQEVASEFEAMRDEIARFISEAAEAAA